jgi:hypothetical protein
LIVATGVYYRVGKMTQDWDSLEDDGLLHIAQKGSHVEGSEPVDTDGADGAHADESPPTNTDQSKGGADVKPDGAAAAKATKEPHSIPGWLRKEVSLHA